MAQKLPNVPGKSITAVVVSYAPGGKSGQHHHAGRVFAYVFSGAIRSENSATGPAKVYKAAAPRLRHGERRQRRQRKPA